MKIIRVITLTVLLSFTSAALASGHAHHHHNQETAPTAASAAQGPKKLEPIFATGKGHIHPAKTTYFDRSILETCGKWGNHVNAGDLLKMFNSEKNQTVMTKMFDRLDKRVLGKKELTFAEFNNELSTFLTRNQGFAHIFCGLSRQEGKSTVGLNYSARMLELQDKGIIGKYTGPKCLNTNKSHGREHLVGIEYMVPGTNQIKHQCKVSFVNGMDGDDMIVEIVKATREISKSQASKKLNKKDKVACYHCTKTAEGKRKNCFKVVVGSNPLEIVSFYPNTNGCPEDSCKLCSKLK